jgi:DNA ligase (NAD+)
MNIDKLGRKTIEQLVKKEFIRKLPDLYRLKSRKLEELEGYAKKSAEDLYDSIKNSKNPDLHRYLYALGIRHVGEHIARLLADEFISFKKIKDAGYDKLVSLKEIGPEIAESISHFFSNEDNRLMLDELEELGVKPGTGSKKTEKYLEGKAIVLTGELESFSRQEAKEKIETLGGRATSSVSGNTDYLVVGDNPGSKLDEAKKENVKIIKEKQFKQLLKTGRLE